MVAEPVVAKEPQQDQDLRPQRLADYINQEQTKGNLAIAIQAARNRRQVLDHLLLYGPPGLGKTTLATIVAHEMGTNVHITTGPAIERPGDLAALLTNVQQGDVIFIDEIHRLSNNVEEVLYPALEDYVLDIVIGKGMGAQSLRLQLPRFTLIGATTRYAMISSPLRNRFGLVFRLDLYDVAALKKIVQQNAHKLDVGIDDGGATEIAKRSRGTPRIANMLLRRARDYAQVVSDGVITRITAQETFDRLGIDSLGLDRVDRQILTSIIDKLDGGPTGIETIASVVAEDADTITDVYEPYLLQLGFLVRTPRGRVVTKEAREYLAQQARLGDVHRP